MIRKWGNQKENPTPNRGGKKLNRQIVTYTKKTHCIKPSEQLFPDRWLLSSMNLILMVISYEISEFH